MFFMNISRSKLQSVKRKLSTIFVLSPLFARYNFSTMLPCSTHEYCKCKLNRNIPNPTLSRASSQLLLSPRIYIFLNSTRDSLLSFITIIVFSLKVSASRISHSIFTRDENILWNSKENIPWNRNFNKEILNQERSSKRKENGETDHRGLG